MTRDAARNETIANLAVRSAAGIGAVLGNRVVRAFGSAADALRASWSDLASVEGMRPDTVRALREAPALEEHEALLDRCEARGIRVLVPNSPDYPKALLELEDRPLVLFARGACVWPERSVALVGTRLPSPAGLKAAREFARYFAARGVSVVSGLARGIDTAAHQASLEADGVTVAVVGSGLDAIYPPENRGLARSIEARGTVLSEYAPDEPAQSFHFPVRNRIISALAQAVVVIEAPRRSGALGTADWALEQGREVMAVPASPYTPSAQGSVDLIKNGAACVTTPEEVFQVLRWDRSASDRPKLQIAEAPFGIELKTVLDFLTSGEPVTADVLALRSGLEAPALMRSLSELEIRGIVAALPGQRWCLR